MTFGAMFVLIFLPSMAVILVSMLSPILSGRRIALVIAVALYVVVCVALPIGVGIEKLNGDRIEQVAFVVSVMFFRAVDLFVYGLRTLIKDLWIK